MEVLGTFSGKLGGSGALPGRRHVKGNGCCGPTTRTLVERVYADRLVLKACKVDVAIHVLGQDAEARSEEVVAPGPGFAGLRWMIRSPVAYP